MESPIHLESKFNRTVTPGELITVVINHVIRLPSLYSVNMCISNNCFWLNVQKTEIIIFGHTDRSKVLHDSLGPWRRKLQQHVNQIGSSFYL